MRLASPLAVLAFFLATGGGLAASATPPSPMSDGATVRGCELGRQQIEELKAREHVGPVILSRDPVMGYDAKLLSYGTDPKNSIPLELKRAWKRQPKTNLLDACPELAAMPGVRLATPMDDVETYGSHTTIYFFSAPVFNLDGGEALLVEGFHCSGRCGGFAINHYQWNGTRWDRKVPLSWAYG